MKRLIITGGSSGIGLNLCKQFLEDGYFIYNISRKKPKLNHKNLINFNCDLSKIENIKKIEKKLQNLKVNALISCAADLGEVGKLDKIDIKRWSKSFNLNLFSHVYLFKIFFNSLIKNKGIVIFFSGGGSANAFPKFSAYSLAKTAIVRLVENISAEYDKIFSYCIAPGPNKTRIYLNSEKFGHSVPEHKMVTPAFTYKLCSYLLKNRPIHLNGKFVHVKDDYKNKKLFTGENFFLRRNEIR